MSFNILAIVPEYTAAEPGLYPLPGGPITPITPEPLDGPVVRLSADRLAVIELAGGGERELVKLRRLSAEVLVTDQRVAVATTSFRRLARRRQLRALTHGIADPPGLRHRSRHRILLGHVRYQWLTAVGFKTSIARRPTERVRLVLRDGSKGVIRPLALDIDLSDARAREIAQHIARRAARFCLAHLDVPDQHRSDFERLVRADPLTDQPGAGFASYELPFALPASQDTAILPAAGIQTRLSEGRG